jgi:hypothetical protein
VGDEKELRFIGLRLDGARHLASRAQKARFASRQTATFVALFIVFSSESGSANGSVVLTRLGMATLRRMLF